MLDKPTRPICQVPPEGWSCSRTKGHDGPCAAHPCSREPVHPGAELLADLKHRLINQVELAKHLSFSASQLNEILHGKRPISPRLAVGLESIYIGNAKYWLYKQADYDLQSHLRKEKESN